MFPFVFRLWRYHGLPTGDEIPDISRAQPASPVTSAVSTHLARTDAYRLRTELFRTWEERYLPRLWGPGHPRAGVGPRVILAVDDGTPVAEGALQTARFMAKRWGAALVETPVVRSREEVLKIADAEGADWIVIGCAHQEEAERVRTGSLAEALVKESDRPVLVDRGGTLTGGMRRILIPVDGTAASLGPVAEGLRWARRFAAELMVLHVEEGEAVRETEHATFLEILESIRWQSIAHETRTGTGTVADAILAAASQSKADLILMGTHRAGIGAELLPQSRALEVLRRADAPVLILHPYED
jgi:nucleotide-binding universal stress UspA family protein